MRSGRLIIALLFIAFLGGCASRRCVSDADCDAMPHYCELVQPQPLIPDLSLVPPLDSIAFDPRTYCNLPEAEAQCLAAGNASLAKLLEGEAEALAAQPQEILHRRRSRECLQEVLQLQAAHERNRAAAAALQLHFRLAEAEGGAANIKLRLTEVAELLHDVQRLQAAGVDSTLSQATVEAQQTDLVHKQVDLEVTIEDMNHQLANLLGTEPPPGTRFWPTVDLKVDPTVPDLDTACHIALQQRADLAAIERASTCDLSAMRTMLRQSGVGLGVSPAKCLAMLHFFTKHRERDVREDQLATTLDDQRRTLGHDLARAISSIETRLAQIGLSQHRRELLQRQLERVEKKRQIDPAAGFEARKARLDVLAADQDVLHDVIEWKLATLKLRELQGDLAIQCGYATTVECE
jgi:hypothetical protein